MSPGAATVAFGQSAPSPSASCLQQHPSTPNPRAQTPTQHMTLRVLQRWSYASLLAKVSAAAAVLDMLAQPAAGRPSGSASPVQPSERRDSGGAGQELQIPTTQATILLVMLTAKVQL